MSHEIDQKRERAFHFDLFVSTDWSERFDQVVADHGGMPTEGHLLEVNCGTGDRVVAVAAALTSGDVVGTEADPERLALARAKALVAGSTNCSFVESDPLRLGFDDASFDGVVVDASLEEPGRLGAIVADALRVARQGAPVAIKIQSHGSFDEYFSVMWEALHDVGIADEVWNRLEPLVTSKPTVADAVSLLRGLGLRYAKPHLSREEWRFSSARELLDSPLSKMLFLDSTLAVVPDSRREAVVAALERIIDREIDGLYFAVTAHALVVTGHHS